MRELQRASQLQQFNKEGEIERRRKGDITQGVLKLLACGESILVFLQ